MRGAVSICPSRSRCLTRLVGVPVADRASCNLDGCVCATWLESQVGGADAAVGVPHLPRSFLPAGAPLALRGALAAASASCSRFECVRGELCGFNCCAAARVCEPRRLCATLRCSPPVAASAARSPVLLCAGAWRRVCSELLGFSRCVACGRATSVLRRLPRPAAFPSPRRRQRSYAR